MSRSISALRAMTDNELIAEHDKHAMHTQVGTNYFVQELERGSRERSTQAAQRLADESVKLARRSYVLTVAKRGHVPSGLCGGRPGALRGLSPHLGR
jgi:hypothetical protein